MIGLRRLNPYSFTFQCRRMVSSSSDGSCQTNDTTSIVDEWRTRTMQEQTEAFDIITASPLNLLANTLNERALSFAGNVLPEKGTVVPGTYHHVYFPPRTRESELAKDGYETVFHPPYPFTQRMWAGAELTFDKENPLCVDDEATMITKVNRIEHRIGGRLGDTVMVWLDKDIYNQKGWSMREQRTLVYATEQEASSSPSPRILKVRKEPDFSMTMHPTSILLFRYSALTFNSHMIHYDQNYAQHVEHHPSCLVHGPLSSTLLITLLRTHLYTQFQSDLVLKSFQYRCLAPLYVNQPLTLFGRVTPGDNKSFELWVNDHQNNLAVKGTAVVA